MAQFFKPQAKKPVTHKHQSYCVTRLDNQGDGVAFDDKKAVFISGALPNEQVIAQLTENKRHYARANLISVVTPSSERVAPFCSHYQQCGGCNLQHLAHAAQIEQKQQSLSKVMTKFAGKKPLVVHPAIVGSDRAYRRSARISLKVARNGTLQFGFRKRSSKDIITITDCPVLMPEINQLLPALYNVLDGLHAKWMLGHIELIAVDNGVALLLRTTKALPKQDSAQIHTFVEQHQLRFYLKQEDASVTQLHGDAPFYRLAGLTLHAEPQDFIQVNAAINEKMVASAIEQLDLHPDDNVLDLFCGLGNFSLPLATKAGSVVGIEGVENMVQRARENAERNQITNAHFYHANLESDISASPWAKRKYTKILLDPARAGAAGILPFLAASDAERILYVSCNPATLARDSQLLFDKGYRLTELSVLDMFPNTGHVESMALFSKK